MCADDMIAVSNSHASDWKSRLYKILSNSIAKYGLTSGQKLLNGSTLLDVVAAVHAQSEEPAVIHLID